MSMYLKLPKEKGTRLYWIVNDIFFDIFSNMYCHYEKGKEGHVSNLMCIQQEL